MEFDTVTWESDAQQFAARELRAAERRAVEPEVREVAMVEPHVGETDAPEIAFDEGYVVERAVRNRRIRMFRSGDRTPHETTAVGLALCGCEGFGRPFGLRPAHRRCDCCFLSPIPFHRRSSGRHGRWAAVSLAPVGSGRAPSSGFS